MSTATSTDAAALLVAIVAHPEEDTPRLVYADCIQEDEPVRAEFIRVQCELAQLPEPEYKTFQPVVPSASFYPDCGVCGACEKTMPDLCRYHDLRRRERTLLPLVARGFVEGVLDWHTHCRLVGDCEVQYDSAPGSRKPQDGSITVTPRRGFVESVTCSAADWLRFADDVLRAHPVTSVTLTGEIRMGIIGGLTGCAFLEAGGRQLIINVMEHRHLPAWLTEDDIPAVLACRWKKVVFRRVP